MIAIILKTIQDDDKFPVFCGLAESGIIILRVRENKVILDGEFSVHELQEIIKIIKNGEK